MQVFRPAVLPDNRRLVWYPLIVCGILAIVGYLTHILPLAICPLLVVVIFPGLPVAIHTVYFFSVKITLHEDTLSVTDYAGNPFVSYPRRQKIALSRIAFVYHLKKEANVYKTETAPSAPFRNTRINLKKYRAADANPRRVGAVTRTDNGLILSDSKGQHRVYIMHFHDLSKKDWQLLGGQFQKANAGISFLMSEKEKKGLLSQTKN